MRIAVGADHGGFELKKQIIAFLEGKGYGVLDFGTYSPEPCDYPLIGEKVAHAVSSGEVDKGILGCTTGIGQCIVANKFPGVRAALCYTPAAAKYAKEHNDANILVIGSLFMGLDPVGDIIMTWLNCEFQGGRHRRRLDQIADIERNLGMRIYPRAAKPGTQSGKGTCTGTK
jgi:ribose 5-phosphate isomerase B